MNVPITGESRIIFNNLEYLEGIILQLNKLSGLIPTNLLTTSGLL